MIALSVLALSVSLTHTFIDLFIGLYGSGPQMNVLQAGLIAVLAALHGWWAAVIARAARRRRGPCRAAVAPPPRAAVLRRATLRRRIRLIFERGGVLFE